MGNRLSVRCPCVVSGIPEQKCRTGTVSMADSMTRRDLIVKSCRTESRNPKEP